MGTEQSELLASAHEWFERDDQIAHYADEAADGPSDFESGLLKQLPEPPAAVLDVGCGAGRIAVPLSLQGYRVTGVDVSDGLLAQAREFAAASSAELQLAKVDPTQLPARTFDAVLSIKQYCYLPGSELRKEYLADLARLVRPGGVLVLTGHVVPSEGEALAALQQDPEHAKASDAFDGLEPLDTFSAGQGFVHWFTREQLVAEVSSLGRPVEVMAAETELQLGLVVRM